MDYFKGNSTGNPWHFPMERWWWVFPVIVPWFLYQSNETIPTRTRHLLRLAPSRGSLEMWWIWGISFNIHIEVPWNHGIPWLWGRPPKKPWLWICIPPCSYGFWYVLIYQQTWGNCDQPTGELYITIGESVPPTKGFEMVRATTNWCDHVNMAWKFIPHKWALSKT
jgi:hypothetical protein